MRAAWLLLGACSTWRQESATGAATVLVEGELRGAEVSAAGQINGIGVRVDIDGQIMERDTAGAIFTPPDVRHQERVGVGIGLGMTFSPLGYAMPDDRFTRWFDFGVSGSLGGGLLHADRLTTYGQAWGGAWAAVGLAPWPVHPALIFEVRGVARSEWDDATVFAVSLALTRRAAAGSSPNRGFGPH